ncbi:MAG: glutathione S-transferase family protein [Porticoccaceae bacterium]
MITIYGSPVSNYYNTVLASLYYKGASFREVHLSAADDADILAKSPMGKIPYIQVDGHYLSETTAILEYLEERFPDPPLYPRDALRRARTRQLIKFIELYVDAPARRLFPGVFWAQANHPVHIEEARAVMERGLHAVDAVVAAAPWLMGETISCGDFYGYFSLQVANRVAEVQYGWNFLAERPQLLGSFRQLEQLEFMADILQQRDDAMKFYLEKKAQQSH